VDPRCPALGGQPLYVDCVRFQRSAASGDICADFDEQAVTVTPRKHEVDHTAAKSDTPVSKAIIIRVEPVSVPVGALPARGGRSGERT